MSQMQLVLYDPPRPPAISDTGAGGVALNALTPATAAVSPLPASEADEPVASSVDEETLIWLDPRDILPSPWQTRLSINQDTVDALAENLIAEGMYHPPLVRRRADGQPEIVAGDIRRLAAIRADLHQTRVRYRAVMSDVEAAAAAAADVVPAQEHTAWEKIQAVVKLVRAMNAAGEPTTIRSISDRSRLSIGHISELLLIVRRFDEEMLTLAGADVHAVNTLSMTALKVISRVTRPKRRAQKLREKLGWDPSEDRPVYELTGTRRGGQTLRIRKPIEQLTAAEARRIIRSFSPSWEQLRARAGG